MTKWDPESLHIRQDLEFLKEHEGRRENTCWKHPEYNCAIRPSLSGSVGSWGCVGCWDVYINRLYVERMGLK